MTITDKAPPYLRVRSGAHLRDARRACRKTQVQVAAAVAVTQQYISALETGAENGCSRDVAQRFSRCLNVALEDLFDPRPAIRTPRVTTDSRVDRKAA